MSSVTFSEKARRALKHYVYIYIDPRDKRVFYVGKGIGNRCFSHLKDTSETEKTERIEELRKLGKRPLIDVLKFGLSEKDALLVESTAIDLLGLTELTNRVRGYGSRVGSRASVEQLAATLDAKPARIDPKQKVILININRAFEYDMKPGELYDATRSAWKISDLHAAEAEYAMSIYRGVVREVYTIAGWFPEGSTLRAARDEWRTLNTDRREFVGTIADGTIRNCYVGRSVAAYYKKGAQNPILYVNC